MKLKITTNYAIKSLIHIANKNEVITATEKALVKVFKNKKIVDLMQ